MNIIRIVYRFYKKLPTLTGTRANKYQGAAPLLVKITPVNMICTVRDIHRRSNALKMYLILLMFFSNINYELIMDKINKILFFSRVQTEFLTQSAVELLMEL